MEGLGAGLAALAFWGFIAAVVVGASGTPCGKKKHSTKRCDI